jgi:NhaA family Na+:H+ antiporter
MPVHKKRLVDRVITPLQEFLRLESAGGLLLMGAAVLAMAVANSPLATYYEALLDLRLQVSIGSAGISKPLLLWINDGLMAIFFLLVGLELKREAVEGHLSSLRNASLPAIAAVGGMLVPAGLYAAFNWGDPVAMTGWAIPAATDIAFALGVISLLGNRVPPALKAFLLSVAIFDDLGAIIIIAFFYTAKLSVAALVISGILVVGLFWMNRAGVARPAAYFLIGIPLWIAVLKSGVHATLAGVVLALFIPISTSKHPRAEKDSGSMLHHLEHALHPWVAFGVLPIFAFANAGVSVSGLSLMDLFQPVPLGIAVGLLGGKFLGITIMSALAIWLGVSSLPKNTSWPALMGTAVLCGIGFTMSLFIASLAFEEGGAAFLGLERLGILVGSLAAGLVGYLWLRFSLRPSPVSD